MSKPRKKRPKAEDTRRERAIRASRRHLSDLKRAHARPPADVDLRSQLVPARISGEPTASYCSSPAQICVECA